MISRRRLTCAIVAGLAAVLPAPALAQVRPAGPSWFEGPDWRAGGAWVQQSRFLEDGNGVSVHGGTTLAIEGGPSWRVFDYPPLGMLVRAGVQVRVALPRVEIRERADSIGPSRGAGRAVLVDLLARLEQDGDGILQYYIALGTVWMRGPADVAPFRAGGVNGFHQAAELGAAVRIARRPLFLTGALHVFGYEGDDDPPVQRGSIGRALLGVRHGR